MKTAVTTLPDIAFVVTVLFEERVVSVKDGGVLSAETVIPFVRVDVALELVHVSLPWRVTIKLDVPTLAGAVILKLCIKVAFWTSAMFIHTAVPDQI